MARAATPTTDHEKIRRWAEAHGGHPAAVNGTGRGDDPGMLRIDFPGFAGEESLHEISWEEFFKWFDVNDLALMYREQDRFNKLVSRKTIEARSRGDRVSRRRSQSVKSPEQRAADTRKRVNERRRKASATESSTTEKAAPSRAKAPSKARAKAPSKARAKAPSKARAKSTRASSSKTR